MKNKNLSKSFDESLSFSVVEGSINEEKRTVKVCALASCVSSNNRYYSPKIVESASGTLKGKKSFADHDSRDTKNLIGRIVDESYKDGKLYASIKISKAKGIASQTWDKINDGTIDSVSIAANGNARPMKLGNQLVSEVIDLDIKSVDFVTEGGVPSAKVIQVFENVKAIPQLSEVKKMIENVKQLREEYPTLVKEIDEAWKVKVTEADKKASDAVSKLNEKSLKDHKEKRISEVSIPDKLKDVLRDKVTGKTTKEVDESLQAEVEHIKKVNDALDKPSKIEGIVSADKLAELNKNKDKDKNTSWTSSMIMENSEIPENLKGDAIKTLWNEGQKEMKAFLKGYGIEV